MLNRDSFLIFLVGVFVFTIGLSPEFLGLDCRFAMFAQEMLRNGPTFFPTAYGQPYPDYLSASTFMIYLASFPFGKVTRFSAVFPVAIISALILVIIYRIGAIHSRQWGLFAVVLSLFTAEFFGLSRSLSPDQYVSLATVLCFYLVYSADIYGLQKRLYFIPLLFAAGFAFRGPLGLVIPAGVLCGYYLYGKDVKKLILTTGSALIVLIFCGIGMLAAAKYQGGETFVTMVINAQVSSRMATEQHTFFYYWYQSFAGYAVVYPLAVLVVALRFKEIFQRENSEYEFLGYLFLWVLVIILGLSIPDAKKIRYIVPMVPAAALIASYIFINPLKRDFLSGIKRMFLGICLWLPAAAFVIIAIMGIISRKLTLNFDAYYPVTLLLMFILAIFGYWLDAQSNQNTAHEIAMMSIGVAAFIGINIGIAEPINYSRNRTGPFVQMVESLQRGKSGEIVFYKINPDGDAIKFMVNLDEPIKPQFVNSPEAILSCKKSAYFIAKKNDFDILPHARISALGNGRIGLDDYVVFNNRKNKDLS